MYDIVPHDEVVNTENYIKTGNIDNIYNKLNYNIIDLDKYILPKLNDENLKIYNYIIENNSIAIHIRRTDYPFHMKLLNLENTVNIEYYKKIFYLLSKIVTSKNKKIFIFSDDQNYVYDNILPLIDKEFKYQLIHNNKNYIDFYLISKCKYIISSLGRFATLAYFFSKKIDKVYISRNNINDLIFSNINNIIFNKYSNYICSFIFPHINNEYIDKYSITHILNLIDNNNVKNIFQVGLYSGIEAKTILNYIFNSNKNISLECFDINNKSSIGSELPFSNSENLIKNMVLHYNKEISDIPDIIHNKEIDMLIFTCEKSCVLNLLYIIYLFPYIKENSIIIFNDLDKEYSFGNLIYNKWIYKKEIFYSDSNNIGYLIVNKKYLLDSLLYISQFSFTHNDLIFFYSNMLYMDCEEYYNYINIDIVYKRIDKLKNYMVSRFDIEYTDKLLLNLNNNINNYFYNIKNTVIFNELYIAHYKLYDNNIILQNNIQNNINKINQSYSILLNDNVNLQNRFNELNQSYSTLFNELKSNINWIKLFGIYNTKNTISIFLFGIKLTFELNENKINKLAWWIPIRKWRDNFRNKFQTRPDQTRLINNIYNDYIYSYNNSKYKKIQPMLQYHIAA
ncbi:hypothetical protein R4K89_11200 [Brachyspira intermedia]|uniref:hypothetical protein n=1 Tax=Brachyspira intermedia TaxID=84377 RepID=UPI0030060DF2